MPKENIAVIIPTYNESSNIGLLLKSIFKALPNALVFIIDDSNEEENKKMTKKINNSNVKIFTRSEKLGRGSAVITGFREALKNKEIEYLFEMDADLSHDPSEFHLFLGKMKKDKVDLVVGSRYSKRGQISDWPIHRRIMSKAANLYLKNLLGLNLTDYTNGFRLYSRRAAEFLIKVDFKTSGFIVLSESAYHLKRNEFLIAEVPVHFKNRKYGKSSVGSEKIFDSFYGILKVRIGK